MKLLKLQILLLLVVSLKSFSQEIKWLTLEEAVSLNKKAPKKMFIKLYTDWCGWCKRMDKDTFLEENVSKYMNENYYCIKLNGEEKKDIVFGGRTYKYLEQGRRGYNEFAAALTQGKLSYPSNIFLDENSNILTNIAGYIKPLEFLKITKYFGDNIYKNSSWEDYNKK